MASRFFATLNFAPAARILVRRSVTSATVNPLLRVTTTIDVSANTDASEATKSRFSVRSKLRLLSGLSPEGGKPGYQKAPVSLQTSAGSPVLKTFKPEPPNAFWALGFPVSHARRSCDCL
jgi:hypothetical protein